MNLSVFCRRFCLLLLATTMFAACSSTRNTGSSDQDPPSKIVDSGYNLGKAKDANQSNIMVHPNEDQPSNLSLNQLIQRLPGVRIQSGRGAYATFVVGGASGSFMSGSGPLFVVNGSVVGTDYSNVHTLVNPHDVDSVSVLKGADASIYGTRGANGVILIRTKKLK
jgi:TonB-dependent SusC/RagA subfamily outer membrane receptor